MKGEEVNVLFARFESAASKIERIECWSAREMQNILGYGIWENFEKVIQKAKGAHRELEDIALTRYACYLVAQNGDASKVRDSILYYNHD